MMTSDRESRLNAAARRLARRATNENSLDERLGPFYNAKTAAARLSVSRSTVYRRIARRELIGLRTSDHQYLFPIWQFDRNGQVPERLSEVLAAMDPRLEDPWGNALWLNSPASFLRGDRPIDRIQRGDLGEVVSIAARIGAMRKADGL